MAAKALSTNLAKKKLATIIRRGDHFRTVATADVCFLRRQQIRLGLVGALFRCEVYRLHPSS